MTASTLFPKPIITEKVLNITPENDTRANIQILIKFLREDLKIWNSIQVEDIQMRKLSAALTNTVYIVETFASEKMLDKAPSKLLLRIYGTGVEKFLDRQHEINWFIKLSELSVAPSLLSTFQNGRIEEFIESITLNPTLMRDKTISMKIAENLASFHKTMKSVEESEDVKCEVWNRLKEWRFEALKSFQILSTQNNSLHTENLNILKNLNIMEDSFDKVLYQNLKSKILNWKLPIVMSHNDLQHGNILYTTTNNIVFVDYEYGSFNYPQFDLANHFCEWCSDFTDANLTPHVMEMTKKFPSLNEQRLFIAQYLTAYYQDREDVIIDEELVSVWCDQVDSMVVLSHLMWGYWGIIQASTSSNTSFDYLGYATVRFQDMIPRLHKILNKDSEI